MGGFGLLCICTIIGVAVLFSPYFFTIEEVVPPPKHVLFYTLDKKKSIVAEAYAVGNSIKSTA